MKLLIKNMVCPRCIIAVKEIFEAEGVTLKSISLGEAETAEERPAGSGFPSPASCMPPALNCSTTRVRN